MANYVLVYHGGSMPGSPEEGARVMQAWTDWFAGLGDTLVDGGNPGAIETSPPTARSVTTRGRSAATRSSRRTRSTRPWRSPRAARSSTAVRRSRSWRRSRRCRRWDWPPGRRSRRTHDDPGRLTVRVVRCAEPSGGRQAGEGPGSGALAAEAVAAVDGLAARRAEGDLSLLAAGRAGGLEHLARGALVATATAAVAAGTAGVATARVATTATTAITAGSLAAGTAGRAATRLGEAALCIEVLLGRGEDECLRTIRARQVLVVVQGKDSFSMTGASLSGSRVSRERSPSDLRRVTWFVVTGDP